MPNRRYWGSFDRSDMIPDRSDMYPDRSDMIVDWY